VCSTASPFKFNGAIYRALFESEPPSNEFEAIDAIASFTHTVPHRALQGLQNRVILHKDHITPQMGLAYVEQHLTTKKHIKIKKPRSTP